MTFGDSSIDMQYPPRNDHPFIILSLRLSMSNSSHHPPYTQHRCRFIMIPLFELILKHVPPPSHLDRTEPFSMLTVQIESDSLGRVHNGLLKLDVLWTLDPEGN